MIRSYHRFNFGKHRDVRVDHVAEVDPYYIWHLENTQDLVFTPAVKRIARAAADRLQAQQRRNARRSVSRGTITNGFY